MAQNGDIANLASLSLSDTEADEDTEDLFASPAQRSSQPPRQARKQDAAQKSNPSQSLGSEEDALAAHEESLRNELNSLRSMNAVIAGITASLGKAKDNMETVSATVNNASSLLTTWTRILSQTEHNQRLILNPNWQGASQDLLDVENEELQRQQEQERKILEEDRRARQREVEREEEERRRALESSKVSMGKGTKMSTRGGSRAGGYVRVGGQGVVRGTSTRGGGSIGRTGSGIGRGTGITRGRGRVG